MKNDKKVLRTIKEINSLCYEFECTVKALGNQDAFTDRIVEKILNKSKELKDLFENQFEKTANKTNILSEEVKEAIEECVEDERECGVMICDFDDRQHDLREIAEAVGVQMVFKVDKQEWGFANSKDKKLVEAALNYYYELHS